MKLFLGVGILGMVILCCVAFVWLALQASQPLTFAESDWRKHALSDGSAWVESPVRMTPKSTRGTDTLPGVTVQKDVWDAFGGRTATFAFGSIECSNGSSITFEEVYRAERDGMLRARKGQVTHQRALSVQGYPAKEFTIASGQDHIVYRIVCVERSEKTQYILVLAGGHSLNEADRTRFIESLKIKSQE